MTIKPEYTGKGTLVPEPTYKHILLINLADWNGSIVLDDGLFLACESTLKHKTVARSNFSSAAAGKEGLFNLGIQGSLSFTVERSGKSLIGSAASGEGLVNVYRGTGKVLLAPVVKGVA